MLHLVRPEVLVACWEGWRRVGSEKYGKRFCCNLVVHLWRKKWFFNSKTCSWQFIWRLMYSWSQVTFWGALKDVIVKQENFNYFKLQLCFSWLHREIYEWWLKEDDNFGSNLIHVGSTPPSLLCPDIFLSLFIP